MPHLWDTLNLVIVYDVHKHDQLVSHVDWVVVGFLYNDVVAFFAELYIAWRLYL